MKHNPRKEERQNTQTKKARINDKIAKKKGHQQERRPNAKKANDMIQKNSCFSCCRPGIRTSEKSLENKFFKTSTEVPLAPENGLYPENSQSPDLPLPHGLAPSETMVSDHGLGPPLSTENPRNKGFSGPGAPIFGFGLGDPATKG